MQELNETDRVKVQAWVDKLAEFNSNVTENAIMEWAQSVPIRPIKDINPAPLFLFNDVSLDKAILNIISNKDVEPAVASIYNNIRNNFCMDVSVVDMPIQAAALINPIQNPTDPWTPVIFPTKDNLDKDAYVNYLKGLYDFNCQFKVDESDGKTVLVKSNDDIPAQYKMIKAMNNFSLPPVNAKLVNVESLLNSKLKDCGYELIDDSPNGRVLLSDGYHDYLIDEEYGPEGIKVENRDGKVLYFPNEQAFVEAISAKKENFEDGDPMTTPSIPEVESEAPMSEDEVEELENQVTLGYLTHITNLFVQDLLYMHHHAVGNDFNMIHLTTEELYEKGIEHLDMIAEMALRNHEDYGNLSESATKVSPTDYEPIHDGDINVEVFKGLLANKGKMFLKALRHVKEYTDDVESAIDSITEYWATEIEYKNDARLKNFAKGSTTPYMDEKAFIVDEKLLDKAKKNIAEDITSTAVEAGIEAIPTEKILAAYDKGAGKNWIHDHEMVDDFIFNVNKFLHDHRDDIAKKLSGALGTTVKAASNFSSKVNDGVDPKLKPQIIDEMKVLGFSEKEVIPLFNNKEFIEVVKNTQDMEEILDAAYDILSRTNYSKKTKMRKHRANLRCFADEVYEEIEHPEEDIDLPPRLKYSMTNPRY